MKRLIAALFFAAFASHAGAQGINLETVPDATPVITDKVLGVDDPGGPDLSRLFTFGDIRDLFETSIELDAARITTGTFVDARIAESNVTQHQAALTIDSASNTLTLDLSEGTLTGTTAEFNTALSDGSFATLTGAETLTGKTLTNPIIGQINDSNGNEALTLTATPGAVNYPELVNAATANDVSLDAKGGDTNIGLALVPKGTGDVTLGNFVFDADQALTASEDNYVFTYDDATGLISLEAAAGGGLSDVVDDTTPQLGGDLDLNGFQITGSGGTVTTSQPVIDVDQEWNDSGVEFTGIKANFTNTASKINSKLIDLQLDGATLFELKIVAGLGIVDGWSILDDGNDRVQLKGTSTESVKIYSSGSINFTDGSSGGTSDTRLWRDAASVFAMRDGENSNTLRVYGRHGSSTDYHRMSVATTKATASAVSGASVTLSSLIPDGCDLSALTTKVETALGTSNGTTGYQVGDGTDPDRWGEATTVTLGTVTQNSDWTNGTKEVFIAAQDVVLTFVGGNADGTGAIEVAAGCITGEAD